MYEWVIIFLLLVLYAAVPSGGWDGLGELEFFWWFLSIIAWIVVSFFANKLHLSFLLNRGYLSEEQVREKNKTKPWVTCNYNQIEGVY